MKIYDKIHTLTKSLLASCLLALLIAASISTPVFAACKGGSFGVGSNIVPNWYKYLDSEDIDGKCRPKFDDKLSSTATKIGIAVVEILMRVVGFIAIGFLIWGGIQYITSQGEPDGLKSARDTITNALVGLVISIFAIGIVQFAGGAFRTAGSQSSLPRAALTSNFLPIINAVGGVAILLSIAFVAFGGFKYATSAGDASGLQKAKNTILYALVGLAVSLSSYAIINFVIGRLQ